MGIYSTSQFIGVAIGGSLGGLLYSLGGGALVFGGCAALALVWLGVSLTMAEPLCEQPAHRAAGRSGGTTRRWSRRSAPARVSDVLLAAAERSVYVKVDSKRLSRRDLESLVAA